jgi:hypothetical protein
MGTAAPTSYIGCFIAILKMLLAARPAGEAFHLMRRWLDDR